MKNRRQHIILQVGLLACLVLIFIASFSCQQEDISTPLVNRNAQLSTSANTIALLPKNSAKEAVTFTWTAGSNQGTNARITYELEMDQAGSDFSNSVSLNIGSAVYQRSLKVLELNNLLRNEFGMQGGESKDIDVRLVTMVKGGSIDPVYSDPVSISVTPFDPLTSTLFLIGDATPNGWNADQATPLIQSPNDPTQFSVQVGLKPGNFKFITTLGAFLPSYNKGEDETGLIYRDEDSQPDGQFVISEPGMYLVKVNLSELTVQIEPQEGPAFEDLYIVGDASPSGWNIDSPEAFIQSEADAFVFTYEGLLTAGEFKILAGSTGDWCGEWYRPVENGQAISSQEVVQLSGCDQDNKWKVEVGQDGFYRITLDQRNMTIDISPVDLYIVGDAGPNGWNINSPEPMDKSGSVYSYSGPLSAGEFKISKFKGDWCNGDWINASQADQSINNAGFIITHGCDGPDNKWRVKDGDAGNYTIKIDLSTSSMVITAN
ncbi:SusF/SusE family outer membrane protein [Echinicola sediminis]